MKKLICLLVVNALCFNTVHSQWRLLTTFPNPGSFASRTSIDAIVFLDRFGEPNTGFIGLEKQDITFTTQDQACQILRTTDAGLTWIQSTIQFTQSLACRSVIDFAFKDKLTGWAVADGSVSALFKTTDGGLTWFPLSGTEGACFFVHYHAATNLLFLGQATEEGYKWSSDEGNSWHSVYRWTTSCSFSDDLNGLITGDHHRLDWTKHDDHNLVTTDGGWTWSETSVTTPCLRPIVIKGSGIYVTTSDSGNINRSDDGGRTWKHLYDFPYRDKLTTTGELFGDLSRMYAQTKEGVFVSTDEGVTWQTDCGPANDRTGLGSKKGFYQIGNTLYAAERPSQYDGCRLWINKTGSIAGPRLIMCNDVSSPNLTIQASKEMSLSLRTPSTFPVGFNPHSVNVALEFDGDVLSPVSADGGIGWVMKSIRKDQGYTSVHFERIPGSTLLTNATLGSIRFQANLASKTSTDVVLVDVDWDLDSNYTDCIPFQLTPDDLIHVDVELSCGDALILEQLRKGNLSEFLLVSPNPTSRFLNIKLKAKLNDPVEYQLLSITGEVVNEGLLSTGTFRVDVSSYPAGSYFLRLSQAGFVTTKQVVIVK